MYLKRELTGVSSCSLTTSLSPMYLSWCSIYGS